MWTLRLFVAARDGCDDAMASLLDSEAARATAMLGAGSRAASLVRVPRDPFAQQYAAPRAFEGVLAVDPPDGAHADALVDVARGADARMGDVVQLDLCGAVVAQRRRIVGSEGPMRFVYLMRHKAGLTTAAFQQHWGGPHAEFGRRTRGIAGYDQLHVDPAASRAAARVAGFGVFRIDGIPELHLRTVEEFVAAAVGSEVGAAAIEDERSFVDARNSVGFVCRVAAEHAGRGA